MLRRHTAIPVFLFLGFCLLLPPPVAAGDGAGMKIIYVVTDDQKLFAWEGNELMYEFDMVSGRPGKETYAGVFHISRK